MQRLNIPLHRYQQTTRLSRRVVSLFAILIAFGYATVAFAAVLWFGRDTTSASAPQDTAVVLHFQPNRFTWNLTERAIGTITLVSNRSLTVRDIRSFTNGEFSVFIGNDGIRSVAVRSNSDKLPTETLDALGILATEVDRGIYLLSDRPAARMEWKPAHVWFGFAHAPGSWHLGELHMVDEQDFHGPIYASAKSIRIRLPKQDVQLLPWKNTPSNSIIALATPALPNASIEGITGSIDTLLTASKDASASAFASALTGHEGSVLITEEENTAGFLVTFGSEYFAKELQQKVIQIAAAMQNPRTRPLSLPDNTTAMEIVVDPSLTTIEETTVSGTLVSRVSNVQGEYLYSAESRGIALITNNRSLLSFALGGAQEFTEQPTCHGNAGYLNIDRLLAVSPETLTSRSPVSLALLNGQFSAASIDQAWMTTSIRLCY